MKLSTYSAIAAISVGMIAGAPAISSAASCGDVNGNGSVTVADVVKLFQDALSSADPADCDGAGTLQCGDINESGTITVSDVVAAFSLVLGEELLYECESEGPTISCPGGTAVVSSNVVTNEVWPASCRIELDGTIFVTDSAVLKIEPGATIFGRKSSSDNSPSALVVRRDAKLNAAGTANDPIFFTSDQTPGTRVAGDWAGLAINGSGPVNCPNNECNAEGLENTLFGGNDANDSSGVIQYVNVSFAGDELTVDNELNIFTLNGVGAKTVLDHIHAHMGLDDGYEWFGGNSESFYVISSAAADDTFDWQIGFRGSMQYGYGRQYDGNIDDDGSRGYEGDNNENAYDANPRSQPKFCNVTLMGTNGQPGDTGNRAMVLRRGTEFQIGQNLAYNFEGDGFQIRNFETMNAACSTTNEVASVANLTGNSFIMDSGFWIMGDDLWDDRDADGANCTIDQLGSAFVEMGLIWGDIGDTQPAGGDTMTDPGIDANCLSSGFNCDPVPTNAASVASDLDCSSIDPSFDDNTYIGAFAPNGENWADESNAWVDYSIN